VWVLDRRGGEARQLTNAKDEITGYEWAPDSKKLVLVMKKKEDPEPEMPKGATPPPKQPKPIVIDRYLFKQDTEGYLTENSRRHLFLFDSESRKVSRLGTEENFEELNPAWSPDGTMIAFVSNHEKDPDRGSTNDVFILQANAGATPRKLVTCYRPDRQHLAFSPDGKLIAYLQGGETKYLAYNLDQLAIVPVAGGPSRVLTGKLDRGVSFPEFAEDGSSLVFLVSDDRSRYPAKVWLSGDAVERLANGKLVVSAQSNSHGHTAVLSSSDFAPPEVCALEGGSLRKLTSHNDAVMSEVQLGAVEDISFKSQDGTEVHGMMVKPPSYEAGKKYPTVLWIHGGPNGQDEHGLPFKASPEWERQLFAASGYVVLAVNYRGSSGRGANYTRSIFADWGNKEVADLLAGVDHVVQMGIADPERLGIGGWSYGGILTDYTIATDRRFKAAISGAGSANQISMYGVDEYVLQYDNELAPPWRSPEAWMKVSYPFFKADRIHTPTLFMGGGQDFNVPIVGGEQMYQALRTLGVPTQLIVYPGEFHGFTRPSFIIDRMKRFVAWYEKYLTPPAAAISPDERAQ
jgi:dipeptidyl aminopeptidase/acylaminoacyl peptidase